jgi:hypothetical protein
MLTMKLDHAPRSVRDGVVHTCTSTINFWSDHDKVRLYIFSHVDRRLRTTLNRLHLSSVGAPNSHQTLYFRLVDARRLLLINAGR